MSFILDALKKSENERQRQVGPSLADVRVRRNRADRPWWAVAVAALLVINLGVLLIVLNRKPQAEEQVPAPLPTLATPQPTAAPVQQPQVTPAPVAAQPASAYANPAVQSLAEVAEPDPSLGDEEALYDSRVVDASAVPEGPPIVRPIAPPTVAPASGQPTFPARDRTQASVAHEEALPTLGSLVASGTSLPDMRLDIHVYHSNPRDRFVFVNMRKYVEGQTLSEGPSIERITADGVILNRSGLRFLLPRQ